LIKKSILAPTIKTTFGVRHMSNTVTGAQDVAAAQEQGIRSVQSRGWSKQDTTWVISLFGTAVGAGILFLPINAGMGGFWPLVVMALLVGPMTYLAHRGLARFVLSSSSQMRTSPKWWKSTSAWAPAN
jgi:4-hydroxybenzoate polyprenyltransferase